MRLLAVVAGLLLGGLGLAAPASAHANDAPGGTNYRTTIGAVTPALPGVTLRVVEAGARLELVNAGTATVEVLGYEGEPYLEIRPDGVYENTNSPATYLNATLAGGSVPDAANPAAAPEWRRVVTEPRARWHDHRVHWMEDGPPPTVAADPGRAHRIRDWAVPLRVGVTAASATGTLVYEPPPSPWFWWIGAAALGAALAAVGLVLRASALMCALLAVSGLAGITAAVGRRVDAGGNLVTGLLSAELTALVVSLGALACALYALRRRAVADFLLALAGAALVLFAGAPAAGVFRHAVPPAPWPGWLARALLLCLIAFGLAAVAYGGLRLNAAGRRVAAVAREMRADPDQPVQHTKPEPSPEGR